MRWYVLLILAIITIGYLFTGAAVFQKLESDNEQDTKTESREQLKQFLQRETCVSKEELDSLVRGVIAAYDKGVLVTQTTESEDNWDLWSSFFFSATVVTTIGYGHISPSTLGGQIFCIFYAIFGIPLVAVFLAGLGGKIHKPFKWFKERSESRWSRILKSVIIALVGFCLLIFLPAYGFHRTEDWTMFEGIYFSIISLTTIGFGDFVPGQQDGVDYRAGRQFATLVWLFVGLAWTAVIISDVADHVSNKVNTYGKSKEEKNDNTLDVYDAEAFKNGSVNTSMTAL